MVLPTTVLPLVQPEEPTEKQRCEAQGGVCDEESRTCKLPGAGPKKPEQQQPQQPTIQQAAPAVPETFRTPEGRVSGVALPGGRTFLGLSPEEAQQVITQQQEIAAQPAGTVPVGTTAAALRERAAGQALQEQVGQFGQPTITPTGLDTGEAIISGVRGAIPDAIKLAGTFGTTAAGVGALAGTAVAPGAGTAIGAATAGAIGGAVGFVSGITRGIQASFAGQRRDTTTAQQRVLDEGKQTMKDWATMAASDPANRATYLAEYNKVSSQIDQAYRQMKLDTSKDLSKYETALPNLAEFEAFYAAGGERDVLNVEMSNALVAPANPTYEMLLLAQRFGGTQSQR